MKIKKLISTVCVLVLMSALTLEASADNFRPSVERKEAPELADIKDKDGRDVAAIIYDASGSELAGVERGYIIVTPLSKADEVGGSIRESLINAFEQIQSAEKITQLTDSLTEAVARVSKQTDTDNLVVRDLFDVTVVGEEYAEMLSIDGNYITVLFKLGQNPEELLMVPHNIVGTEWETIDPERVIVRENGDVEVSFDSLSPVAFVVEAEPAAPETRLTIPWALIIGALLVAAGLILACVYLRKEKKETSST